MKDNKTAYAILGLLSHEPMTGYDMKKRIEVSLCYFWNAGFGQIYPALTLLESRGCVEKKTEVVEKRPKRIVYSITDKGLGELKRWLAEPVEREDVKYEILLKLFFGKLSPVERNIAVIDEFRARNAKSLRELQGFEHQLKSLPDDGDHLYYYLTALFGEKVHKAYLEWAVEAESLLKERTAAKTEKVEEQ